MRRSWSDPGDRSVRPVRLVTVGLAGLVSGLVIAVAAPLDNGGRAACEVPSSDAAGGEASRPSDDSVMAPEPGPTRTEHGVPAGFARTEAGAVAAAAAFVVTGQALLDMDRLAVEFAVRQMAAEATADTQARTVLSQLEAVHRTLGRGSGPIVYRQAALAWRVEGYTRERARVAIWSVSVLSRDGVAPPQAGWRVSTLDLVWEREDWRIWGETIVPGPAPILDDSTAPATSGQLAVELEGFHDFRSVP